MSKVEKQIEAKQKASSELAEKVRTQACIVQLARQ
jgi:hypothetical protein